MQCNPINTSMSAIEWAMLLALSVLWGGSFFFVGVAVKELPTLTVVVARVAIAALLLLLLLRVLGIGMPKEAATWRAFLAMGFLNNAVPFSLIVWAQAQIASGVASILNAATPLFGVIVAHAFTADEKMTGRRLIGVVTGFAGVAIMIGGDALGSLGGHVAGQIACLGAALSYAFAGVYGRRFKAMGVPPLASATGQVTASSGLLIPLAIVFDRPWLLAAPSLDVFAALVGLAALSTALAYALYFRILATAGATNLLLVTFLIPVSAILLGVLVLHESFAPRHFAGMALISAGLAIIDGRLARLLSKQKPAATRGPS
jgi:drug/metabolite transporter (DMT)-like permease